MVYLLPKAAMADTQLRQLGTGRPIYQIETLTSLNDILISHTELGFGTDTEVLLGQNHIAFGADVPVLTRTIPTLWRTRIPLGHSVHNLSVHIEVISSDGQENHLSHLSGPDLPIPITLYPQPPTVVDRDRGFWVVEGGALLNIDLSRARYGGNYTGTLKITIDQL